LFLEFLLMKILLPALLMTTAVLAMPVSHARAQEAAVLDESAIEPVASETVSPEVTAPEPVKKVTDPLDPVSGTVPPSELGHYDSYERQLRYGKADQEYRASLEERRISYQKPQQEHYKAYLEKLNPPKEKPKKVPVPPIDQPGAEAPSADSRPIVPIGEPGDGMEQAPDALKEQEKVAQQNITPTTVAKTAPAGPKVGIKEIEVEATREGNEPTKKVVVPADAPTFERSPF
jgi:hypothetical protein